MFDYITSKWSFYLVYLQVPCQCIFYITKKGILENCLIILYNQISRSVIARILKIQINPLVKLMFMKKGRGCLLLLLL